MAQVLVLDHDRDVRTSMQAALELEGHRVLTTADAPECLALLAASVAPLVALCGNEDPANQTLRMLFAEVAANTVLTRRHRYICLTTTPEAIPTDLHVALARLAAPIMEKPFALDELLGAVGRAAGVESEVLHWPPRIPW